MKKEKNNQEKVRDFLQTHAVAVLSTMSYDDTPYAAAVYVVIDDVFNFYFLTKSDTKKSRFVLANNNAALTMVDAAIPMTLQATGTVTIVDEPETLSQLIVKYAEKNAQQIGNFHWPPTLAKLKGQGALWMYKFEPNWMRIGDFSDSDDITVTKKDIFHQLIP